MDYQPNPSVVAKPPVAGHRGLIIAALAVLLIGAGVWWFLPSHGGSEPAQTKGSAVLSIRTPTEPVLAGMQFKVEVYLDAGAYQATAADIVLAYDDAKFDAVGISPGTLLSAELAGGAAADGKATITVASGTTAAKGSGVVAVLTLVAHEAGAGAIAFEKGTQVAAVGQSGNIVGKMQGATVTVR